MKARTYSGQKTLRRGLVFTGKGLHSGRLVTMQVEPAGINQGISFIRSDLDGNPSILARANNIFDTKLCTRIGNNQQESIGTVEHLLAAFAGLSISNVKVVIDGPEIPIMDGSSKVFVDEFLKVGLVEQDAPVRAYVLKKSLELMDDKGGFIRAEPSERTEYQVSIDFEEKVIGRQSVRHVHSELSFLKLANARTFCKLSEVAYLQSIGLAQGGSLENAVVISESGVLNEGGLRYSDEFVRHKLLDCIGDLALLGAPLLAKITTHKGGHGLHAKFMKHLLAHFSEFIDVVERSGVSDASDIHSLEVLPVFAAFG